MYFWHLKNNLIQLLNIIYRQISQQFYLGAVRD